MKRKHVTVRRSHRKRCFYLVWKGVKLLEVIYYAYGNEEVSASGDNTKPSVEEARAIAYKRAEYYNENYHSVV